MFQLRASLLESTQIKCYKPCFVDFSLTERTSVVTMANI